MLLLASSGLLAVFALILGAVLARRRCYLRVSPTGFVYTNSVGERTFLDEEVMCIGLSSRNNYLAGTLMTITRRFIMWIETGGVRESIVCVSHFKPNQDDPLSPLIVRMARRLHAAARDAYAAGQRVAGDGWALERNQLLLSSKRSTSVTAVGDLTAADMGDEHLRIWRKGIERPIARIPLRTANAHLLGLMLGELIPAERYEKEADLPPRSLGRLLFERGPGSRVLFLVGWLLTLALGISSFVVFRRAAGMVVGPEQMQFRWIAGSLGVAAFLFAVSLLRRKGGRFRRFAFGIQQRGFFGVRSLRFTEIGNMTYSSHRNHSHGVYTGTTLTMSFVPIPSTGLRPIRTCLNIKNSDAEFDKLRDDVAVVIARRMHDFWSQNGYCPWMPFLRFVQEGVEYQPLTYTGRKQAKVIPYATITNFSIDESLFRVWIPDQKNAVINEDIGQPNFYPGLVFLTQLLPSFQEGNAGALHHSDRN